MKLAIIGVRGHVNYIWESMPKLPELEIVGLSPGCAEDSVNALVAKSKDLSFQPEIYDDYRQMLDESKPDILGVCGPFELHSEMCVEAFKSGIHVFCEKPVATTMSQLSFLREEWERSGVHFAAMVGMRCEAPYYTAKALVSAGKIGKIRMLNARKSYKLGNRPDYYKIRDSYGGTLLWVGSHAIDWIYWLSGEKFQRVDAFHSTIANNNHGDLETTALCQFKMSNDVIASASNDYYRPQTASTHGDDRVRIVGTKGIVEVQKGNVYLMNQDTDGELECEVETPEMIFENFVNHIQGKSDPIVTGEDTLAVAEACLKAREAADSGNSKYFN